MNFEQAEILNKTDSEIYLILADQLISKNLLSFMTPISDDEKKNQSERWFKKFIQNKNLKEKICNSNFVMEKTKKEEVIATLSDIIMRCFYKDIPDYISFTLAVLIIRYGLQEYCSHEDSSI